MADLAAFIANESGKQTAGDTPENTGECVGLVEKWFDTLGLAHIWGNACDMPANADRTVFDVIPNSPTYIPPVGAAICWPAGWEGSSVGHTAIVAPGTSVDLLTVFEQNDRVQGGNGTCRLHSFNYGFGLTVAQMRAGWPKFIVPKKLIVQGGDDMIPDQNHLDVLFRWAYGRHASAGEVKSYVGFPYSKLIEVMDAPDSLERNNYLKTMNTGQLAVRELSDALASNKALQDANAELQTELKAKLQETATSAQNTPQPQPNSSPDNSITVTEEGLWARFKAWWNSFKG